MISPKNESAPLSASSGAARIGGVAFFIGVGAYLVAAAMRWVEFSSDPDLPDWIVGLFGFLFMLLGIAVALPWRMKGLRSVLGALVVTVFATIVNWIGFGPGPRFFSGSFSDGLSLGWMFVSGESQFQ